MHYGIDIGGTKIELAIFDKQLNLISAWREPTPTQDYQQFLDVLTQMVQAADNKTKVEGTVGIGFPGTLDKNQNAISANIPCLSQRPLISDISKALNRSIALENDVNTFIISETINETWADKNALGVILGTGTSGGLSINNSLYRSRQNIAGEFGHTPLSALIQQKYDLPLRQCGCGLVGCIEQYVAGPGLLWLCSHLHTHYQSVPELIDAVNNDEPAAIQVLSAYIDILGSFFAQLILVYDPDVIILGGGLSNIKNIYPLIPQAVLPYLFKNVTVPPIIPATFGDSSGVRGAAFLGKQLTNNAI